MRRKNDMLWKGMLEEVFDDLLRFVFPDVEEELDLNRGFEFLDKELIEMYPEPEKAGQTRFVDKLVKVYKKDGGQRWLLVHVEVQDKADPEFAKRMFKYYYRILDRYDRPVTAIAIFTGLDGKKMPDRFEDRCLGTHQVYRYNTLWVGDYPDEVLAVSENPFALVLLAAKKALRVEKNTDEELMTKKLMIVRLLHQRGIFGKRKIEAILTFLHNYVLFQNKQTNRIFMEQIDQITGKQNTMGIIEQLAEIKAEEALKKGRQEGEDKLQLTTRQFVENLLSDSEFSIEKIASLANVSVDFVRIVKQGLRSK